ncbi:unnamed protein product [Ixodes hexagonus]
MHLVGRGTALLSCSWIAPSGLAFRSPRPSCLQGHLSLSISTGATVPTEERQRQGFRRRYAAHDPRPLGEGESVWIRDADCAGTVLSRARRPRSYVVQTDLRALLGN